MLVGVGLIIMTGLDGGSSWTHLLPGFIVAGLGGGLVNPPLASTAIGVVPPHRAGMASGVNTTFRQIGIATAIAALGSIFTAAMERNLSGNHATAAAGSAAHIVTALRQDQIGKLLASVPPAARGQVAEALRAGFAAGINDLVIITGIVALAGALCAMLLIRSKDFVRTPGRLPRSPQRTRAAPIVKFKTLPHNEPCAAPPTRDATPASGPPPPKAPNSRPGLQVPGSACRGPSAGAQAPESWIGVRIGFRLRGSEARNRGSEARGSGS